MVKKMIQEESLAEQIETQGYHLREANTTLDFTQKAAQVFRENTLEASLDKNRLLTVQSGRSGSKTGRSASGPNPANGQYILFLEEKLDALSQPEVLAERTKLLESLEKQSRLILAD